MGYLKKIYGMALLGKTPEGTCPECAVKHDPEQPHNRDKACAGNGAGRIRANEW